MCPHVGALHTVCGQCLALCRAKLQRARLQSAHVCQAMPLLSAHLASAVLRKPCGRARLHALFGVCILCLVWFGLVMLSVVALLQASGRLNVRLSALRSGQQSGQPNAQLRGWRSAQQSAPQNALRNVLQRGLQSALRSAQ